MSTDDELKQVLEGVDGLSEDVESWTAEDELLASTAIRKWKEYREARKVKTCPFCGNEPEVFSMSSPPVMNARCPTCGFLLKLETWNQRVE